MVSSMSVQPNSHIQSTPTILFDVDSVLAATTYYVCAQIRAEYDIAYYPSDCTEWDAYIPGADMYFGEYLHLLNEQNEEYLLELDPVSGAVDTVNTLYDAGWTVLIGTHRPKVTQETTQKWLANHGFRYTRFATEIYQGIDKHIVNPDIIVDDYHDNVEAAVTHGDVSLGVLVVCPWTVVPEDYENRGITLVETVASLPNVLATYADVE